MPNNDLILERVKRWTETLTHEQRKKPTLFTMDGRTFTPDQVLEEIEKDTPIGKVFKRAEELMLERTLQKKMEMGL
ncbi:hypothetical protein ES703_66066 [subsurface metagenome]